jgi:hypothetical protein
MDIALSLYNPTQVFTLIVPPYCACLLEPLAMLWATYAFQNNHWTHAFKLLGTK